MIISASRRTDIPAFYSEWLINRLNEGYVIIPNSRDAGRLGRVSLSPGNVDCIVFWTKNPAPMMDKLKHLDAMGYSYYIQFTLTPYGRDTEVFLPPKSELMETFTEMSGRIGKERSVWRYDPVYIDEKHPVGWHVNQFSEMCGKLQPYAGRCVLSFIDIYRNSRTKFREMTNAEITKIAESFSQIAEAYGLSLYTCSEEIDLAEYGIRHAACIDKALIELITGYSIKAKKDANQRAACRCVESVDIGAYDTCLHGCAYCYAVPGRAPLLRRGLAHDPNAPMITGYPAGHEIVTDRTRPSQKINQISLTD